MKRNLLSVCMIAVMSCSSLIWYGCEDVCSCKKESCPGYINANLDAWFPYQTGQQPVFADSSRLAAKDTIRFTNVEESGSYEEQRGCYNGASGCSQHKDIYSSKFSMRFSKFTAWDGTATTITYTLTLDSFTTTSENFDENGFVAPNVPSQFYPSLFINGKSYQNVQVLYNPDTTGATNVVEQVYIQKGNGLLAYRYYPSGSLFVKN